MPRTPEAGEGQVTTNGLDPLGLHEDVVGPLVRVIEEAADEERWALVGAAACRAQGCDAPSQNLEFVTTTSAVVALAEMLDLPLVRRAGRRVEARRVEFMRGAVPVFVFGDPVFHGNYESLAPVEIPSLWDACTRIEVGGTSVTVTPLEWELLLAVVLGTGSRASAVAERLRERGVDGRLLTRLLREGRVQAQTEEAVWAHVERREPPSEGLPLP